MLIFRPRTHFAQNLSGVRVFNALCEKDVVTSEDDGSRQFHNLPPPTAILGVLLLSWLAHCARASTNRKAALRKFGLPNITYFSRLVQFIRYVVDHFHFVDRFILLKQATIPI